MVQAAVALKQRDQRPAGQNTTKLCKKKIDCFSSSTPLDRNRLADSQHVENPVPEACEARCSRDEGQHDQWGFERQAEHACGEESEQGSWCQTVAAVIVSNGAYSKCAKCSTQLPPQHEDNDFPSSVLFISHISEVCAYPKLDSKASQVNHHAAQRDEDALHCSPGEDLTKPCTPQTLRQCGNTHLRARRQRLFHGLLPSPATLLCCLVHHTRLQVVAIVGRLPQQCTHKHAGEDVHESARHKCSTPSTTCVREDADQ
mmetsp:Transcript_62197/g.148387  ORF Transcript_62197/g.148387 Transcript_62197/m.148387 type:complete len:258 (+) Transcript_62197:177-950(+)